MARSAAPLFYQPQNRHTAMATRECWSVPVLWPGATAFILAGGPSAAPHVHKLVDQHAVVVNSAWRALPRAEFLVFADSRWYDTYGADVRKHYKGTAVTVSREIRANTMKHPVKWIKKVDPTAGLREKPDTLTMRRTSTAGAIHLAIRLGAVRLVLVGVDGKLDTAGKRHHHTDAYPWPLIANSYAAHARELEVLAPKYKALGVEVLNANPDSAITAFPFTNLDDHL